MFHFIILKLSNFILADAFDIFIGTPYLFHTYSYSVDPDRGAQLAPSFQAANGVQGATLVASYGTGKNPNNR